MNETKNGNQKELFLTHSPRERVLAAALKLFVEQGFFNTNIQDLSRESLCSVGSIYHYFTHKEEIAASLYLEGVNAFRHELAKVLEFFSSDPEKAIRQIPVSLLEFAEMNQNISRYLWLCRHNEFMTDTIKRPLSVGFDPLGRLFTKTIKAAIKNKQIRPLKANIIWSIVFGTPIYYVRDWLDGISLPKPTTVAEEISEACWRAIKS